MGKGGIAVVDREPLVEEPMPFQSAVVLLGALAHAALATSTPSLHQTLLKISTAFSLSERGSWNYHNNGLDWPGLCATGLAQSPVALSTNMHDVRVPAPRGSCSVLSALV